MKSIRVLPNLIIAGVPKAGTSSLHTWLADHPDALGSIEKETYYFVDPETHMFRPDMHISSGLENYSMCFRPESNKNYAAVIESTPSYVYSETALKYLPDLPTNPKFIFILREPSDQIYSIFKYFQNNWTWISRRLSFQDYIDQVAAGRGTFKGNELAANALDFAAYAGYLLRWRERVGLERMRVWLFDELRDDQLGFTKRAAEFAGLDPGFYDHYGFPRTNETYVVRSGALQTVNTMVRGLLPRGQIREMLRTLYRRLNTRKAQGASEVDEQTKAELRSRFVDANARLAKEFDLDLSTWI